MHMHLKDALCEGCGNTTSLIEVCCSVILEKKIHDHTESEQYSKTFKEERKIGFSVTSMMLRSPFYKMVLQLKKRPRKYFILYVKC